MKNKLKLVLVAFSFFAFATLNAQTIEGSIGKKANADLGSQATSVKVVDNKGTIKYMQVQNGLTSWTDAAADGGTVTTWQLGGALTSNTNITTGDKEFKITLDSGDEFVIDGMVYETGTPAENNAATTGWTILVRDEANGQIKKLLPSDLVSGIRVEYIQGANATENVDITVVGLPILTAGTTAAKLFVFRNGVKLRTGTDFTATAGKVQITYNATNLPMYKDDVIEIQYIK